MEEKELNEIFKMRNYPLISIQKNWAKMIEDFKELIWYFIISVLISTLLLAVIFVSYWLFTKGLVSVAFILGAIGLLLALFLIYMYKRIYEEIYYLNIYELTSSELQRYRLRRFFRNMTRGISSFSNALNLSNLFKKRN